MMEKINNLCTFAQFKTLYDPSLSDKVHAMYSW